MTANEEWIIHRYAAIEPDEAHRLFGDPAPPPRRWVCRSCGGDFDPEVSRSTDYCTWMCHRVGESA